MSRIPFEFLIENRAMPTFTVLVSRYNIFILVSILFQHNRHRRPEENDRKSGRGKGAGTGRNAGAIRNRSLIESFV
jgi:hypothetical protein